MKSSRIKTPLGEMFAFSSGGKLSGLYFADSLDLSLLQVSEPADNLAVFKDTKHWLEIYFSGKEPSFTPPLILNGVSEFRLSVWQELLKIPFAASTTYGELAISVATKLNKPKMSAQAIGGAVSANPISIIVPCHRVLAANKKLGGYAGGVDKKIALLNIEKISFNA